MFKQIFIILFFFSFLEFHQDSSAQSADKVAFTSNLVYSEKNPKPIAVVGDLQKTSIWEYFLEREENDPEREKIISSISKENIGGMVILGDMVFDGSDEDDWRNFDKLLSPIREKDIPVLPVIGNHEYWGSNENCIYNIRKRFPRLFSKHWYVVKYGELALIILDTNDSDLTEYEWNEQQAWFEKTLNDLDEDPSTKGVIVFTHHPPYTNSTLTGDEEHVKKAFIPAFNNSSKTVAFISGHAHTYERFIKKGKTYIVSGGGGGPRVTLNVGTDFHKDHFDGVSPRPFNYILLENSKGGVTVYVKGLNKGENEFYLLERFTLLYN